MLIGKKFLLSLLLCGSVGGLVMAASIPSGPSVPVKDIIEIKKGVEYIQKQLSGVDTAAKANLAACGVYDGKEVDYYNDPNGLGVLQLAGINTEDGKKKWCYNGVIVDNRGIFDYARGVFNRTRLDAILSTEKKFTWQCVFNGGKEPIKVTCSIYRKNIKNRDETTFSSYNNTTRDENDSIIKQIVSKFNEDQWYGVWHNYGLLKYFTNGWVKFDKNGLKNYKHTGKITGKIGFISDINQIVRQKKDVENKILEDEKDIEKNKGIVSNLNLQVNVNNKQISALKKDIESYKGKISDLSKYYISPSRVNLYIITKRRILFWTRTYHTKATYGPMTYIPVNIVDEKRYKSLPTEINNYDKQISSIKKKISDMEEKKANLVSEREKKYKEYVSLLSKMFNIRKTGIHVGYLKARVYEPANSRYFYIYKYHSSAEHRARINHTIVYGKKRGWYHYKKRFVFNNEGYNLYKKLANLEDGISKLDYEIGGIGGNVSSYKKTLSLLEKTRNELQDMLNQYNTFVKGSNDIKNKLKKSYLSKINSLESKIKSLQSKNDELRKQIDNVNLVISKIIKDKINQINELKKLDDKLNSLTSPITVKVKVNGVCNPNYNNKNLSRLVFGDYLCSAGKFVSAKQNGSLYTWKCQGFNGGKTVSCKAAASIPRCDLTHAYRGDTYRIRNGNVDKCIISRRSFSAWRAYKNFYGRLSNFCNGYENSSSSTSRRYSIAAEFWNRMDGRKILGPVYNSDLNNYLVRGRRGGKYRAKYRHRESGRWRLKYYDSWHRESRHRHGVKCIAYRESAHWQSEPAHY